MKIVLAYSGGLDTSVILKWLINAGYEVICYIANVGQDEDFERVKSKALKIGATKVVIEDLKQEFIEEYIFKAMQSQAYYEGSYLLGTAIARPLIGKRLASVAQEIGATHFAHGATGKGNDQVRFELVLHQMMPEATIIAPWREATFLSQFKGREDLIAYANKEGIPISSSLEKPYSMDENLLHTSFEGGFLEDLSFNSSDGPFHKVTPLSQTPDHPTTISITFKRGIPSSVYNHENCTHYTDSVSLFECLNALGNRHGIGRIDIVESRFIGIKSRGIYETPGGTILWRAYHDLETLVLDKEVLHLKSELAPKIAQLIYNGLWFSPEMALLQALISHSQEKIEGTITLQLFKGHVTPIARDSKHSLYDSKKASMNEVDSFNQKDAEGFIKIHALRLRTHSV